MLLCERLPEVVLADRAALEKQGAQPPAGESLHAECACHVVFGRRPEGDEDLPDSRHELGRHYRPDEGTHVSSLEGEQHSARGIDATRILLRVPCYIQKP